jgi:hypothetical protein
VSVEGDVPRGDNGELLGADAIHGARLRRANGNAVAGAPEGASAEVAGATEPEESTAKVEAGVEVEIEIEVEVEVEVEVEEEVARVREGIDVEAHVDIEAESREAEPTWRARAADRESRECDLAPSTGMPSKCPANQQANHMITTKHALPPSLPPSLNSLTPTTPSTENNNNTQQHPAATHHKNQNTK